MKRRTSTATVRVYQYGLPFGPLPEHAERVDQQLYAAHRYRNELVAIERGRRGAVREVLGQHGDVAPLDARISELTAEIVALRQLLRLARQQTRRRVRDPEKAARIKEAQKERSALRADRRAILDRVAADPEIRAKLDAIETRLKIWLKVARATSGVYWGTYLLAEAAAQQARGEKMDPKFRAARAYSDQVGIDGSIGVQLQGGLGTPELLACTDQRVRLEMAGASRGGRRQRAILHVRVGSDGRAPIWASFPLVLHRPLPDDARLTWVRVQRRRIGTRFRWVALITAEAHSLDPIRRLPSVTAAVDIGWRRVEGGLAVATVRSEDGGAESIVMPWSIVESFRHADSIRSIRDRLFEERKPPIAEWLRTHELPAWLRLGTATVAHWRHGAKLTRLAYRWSRERFPGDVAGFDLVDAWRRRDRHLYQYEAGARDGALLRRREFYRVQAVRLAARYPRIVLAKLDLRETAKHVQVENGEDALAAREYRFVAAAGEFRAALSSAVVKSGGTVESVAVESKACHACGGLCAWDAAVYETHTCEHCGARWHVDDNQCRKLLAIARGRAA